MDRIALFQYEWPFLSYTSNLALKLAESGYFVDYFQKDCSLNFFQPDAISNHKNISVYSLSLSRVEKWGEKVLRKMFEVPSPTPEDEIISKWAFKKSLDIIKKKSYKCFIGIEKKGLIWAGEMAEIVPVPYIYFNTELYIEDHPVRNEQGFEQLRKKERKYHRLSRATIIQDSDRADVLLKANEISSTDLVYIPISILGDINEKRDHYFHETFKVPRDKKIILCLGQIMKGRLSFELAKASKNLDDGYVMVLHGPAGKDVVETLKSYSNEKLIISEKLVPSQMLRQLAASAYIGLVIFNNDCSNNRLTAVSSEKIAYYTQSGLPIIALDIGNYRKLMEAYPCGELIGDIKDLNSAIDKITKNYEYYCRNSYAAYSERFNFERHYHILQAYLERMN